MKEKTNSFRMKNLFYYLISLCVIFAFVACSTSPQSIDDRVTIKGYVTDYDGNPLDNVSVGWQDADFTNEIFGTTTDSTGFYDIQIKKGRYHNMGALNIDTYIVTGSILPEEDMRLEFWGWNFIADRDTTFNMQYDRFEVYGVNVFRVQGGAPGYHIFCRPMSLTRGLEQKRKLGEMTGALAPRPESLGVKVTIDGEEVPVRMKQPIKEYWDETEDIEAYLLFVGLPKAQAKLPYRVFRIQMTDLENGDKGEATYHHELKEYIKE